MSINHKRIPTKQANIREELLTIDELALVLKVQKGWIYGRTRDRSAKTIPHFKVGKYLRFSLPEVKAWLQEQHRGWQQEK